MSPAMTPGMELCSANTPASAMKRPPSASRSASRAPPIRRCHSHRTTRAASHQKAAKMKPPIHAVASAKPPIATAAATRGFKSGPKRLRGAGRTAGSPPLTATRPSSRRRLDRGGFDNSAKTTFPRRVLVGSGVKGTDFEIRPKEREKHELSVGCLPEQEVRKPHLPGGANDEIGIG